VRPLRLLLVLLMLLLWNIIKYVFVGVVSPAEGLGLPIPRLDLGTILTS